MAAPTDAELWHRARRGSVAAFGELHERHARTVNSYCLWRTAAKQLAEEITVTVFLETWRRRRRLALRTESAAPLLLAVAVDVERNYWRNHRRHARALERIGRVDLSPWDEREAVARVDAMSEVREAGAAIRTLPPREREPLTLLLWGGLSHAETASALGISVGIVRSRVARARSRLGGAGDYLDSYGELPICSELPNISLLLTDDSTLAARRRALEASCGPPAKNLLGWTARTVPAGRSWID